VNCQLFGAAVVVVVGLVVSEWSFEVVSCVVVVVVVVV
jgi:hypothetical protein